MVPSSFGRAHARHRLLVVSVAVLSVALGCDQGTAPRPASAPRGGSERPQAPQTAAPAVVVPPLPAEFSVVIVNMGESGAMTSLSMSAPDGHVQAQLPGAPEQQLGVLDAAEQAALWRLLHEGGFARFVHPARGLPGETILQLDPGGQAAYRAAQEPAGYRELVTAVEHALRAAGRPRRPQPASLAVFVADSAATPPANRDPTAPGIAGIWLEPDGTVARQDESGLRLVGVLPTEARTQLWRLLDRGGFDRLPSADPSDPVVLAVWVEGREHRLTGDPASVSDPLRQLQRRTSEHLGTGLTPLPTAAPAPPRPADLCITVARGGGYAGQWDEWVVGADGAVVKRSRRATPVPVGQLSPAVLDAMWQALHAAQFFTLGNVPHNMTDAISVHADGRDHHVAYMMGGGPVRFRIVLAMLREQFPR